jgi:biopolymer transport protein ExbD
MRRSVVESKSSGFTEINTTPLIDVSLVLVVILLLATPLAMESAISVKSRAQSGRTAQKSEEAKRLELTILDEQTIRVNRQTVALADLAPTIRPMIQSSPDQLVVVRCLDGVTHGAFVSVLDEAKLCGAAQIAIVEK